MGKITLLYLAVILCSTIIEGLNSSPACDEITWNAFECIQFLQRTNLELQDRLTNQEDQLKETQVNLKNLQNNLVPIGFVYAQLPNQPEPQLLWDSMTWSDISSQYAGLFFRVLGGGSQVFNFTQGEFSPRITEINQEVNAARRNSINLPSTNVISTGGSPALFTSLWGLRFVQSTGEVRPRNSAVRIWIRSA